jgi:hypothetical protein
MPSDRDQDSSDEHRAWEPVEPHTRDFAHLWDPPWRRDDSVRVVVWLIVAPSAIVLVVIGLWRTLDLDTTQLLIAGLAGYAAWAVVGGAIVRPRSRFGEVAIIAAIVIVLMISLPAEWLAAADEQRNGGQGQDIGAGVGIALLYVTSVPPTLAFLALGRFASSRLRRCSPGRQ